MKPRKEIAKIGKKLQAKLDAAGEKRFSTIAPPKPDAKPKRRAGRMGAMPQRVSGTKKSRKPIAKVGKQKAKRQARNRAYYASPEWRAKRKAVFQRDGYQCTETLQWLGAGFAEGDANQEVRCPNRGEIVNGKQTARGLVCEEVSYRHRGVDGYIDTCKTRCRDCDRRLTPLERANYAQGFRPFPGERKT